jgi:hypothetical protein
MFWLRVALGIPAAVLVQVIIHRTANLQPDKDAVSAFVGAMGTLYSVLAGFTVVSVWQQFSDTDRAVKREARNLRELWRYVGYVEDPEGVARARRAIERYLRKVVAVEWPEMIARKAATAAEDDYFAMADAVNAITVTTRRDVPAWAEAVRTLGEVSDARGERQVYVAVRMPLLLRTLLYIATITLLLGIALLRFQEAIVGGVVLTAATVVSILVLEVIDDLDDPFGGAWTISTAPFDRLEFRDDARME